MPARYLLVRSDGCLRQILRLGVSSGKGELYISPGETGGSTKIYSGTKRVTAPKGQVVKGDIDFTTCDYSEVNAHRGKFHIGYKCSGESVAVVGPLKNEFTVPGLKNLDQAVSIQQFYPARLDLFPSTTKIRDKDILLPDMGRLHSDNLLKKSFAGQNVEDFFGEDSFDIEFVMMPKSMLGGTYIAHHQKDDVLKSMGLFVNFGRFVLGVFCNQDQSSMKRGWFDHSIHVNARNHQKVHSDGSLDVKIDFRIIRTYFREQ